MPIVLFALSAYNEQMYHTATAMLDAVGKAVIVHRAGVGKGVIASKRTVRGMDEPAVLCPECIILDEFHRRGAEHRSTCVQRLLEACPRAKRSRLLGSRVGHLDGDLEGNEPADCCALFERLQISQFNTRGQYLAAGKAFCEGNGNPRVPLQEGFLLGARPVG